MMFPIISALLFLGGAATVGLGIGGTKQIIKMKKSAETNRRREVSHKLQEDLEGLKTSLRSRIDEEIQAVLFDAEQLRRHLVEDVDNIRPEEKRFSMDVSLRSDEMAVFWVDNGGNRRHTSVAKASLTGISFEARGFDAVGIERITLDSLGISLGVKKADVVSRDNGAMVTATLVEFEDNENSWLTWVELMTRVGRVDALGESAA
ncbi:MAG: hypothetical protein HQL33_11675 [Alphaproteobacteria bacterium]|nr:hypothetical protein [Alphaproteobacteria bacterium]